ncbi:nicotinate-nucleotide adenylyltransferase [Methylomagnum sp.]
MIGIYGGTFDPIHYGHLRTALEVKEAAGLDEVRLIPSQIPPHRGAPGATPEQRLAMLRAALEDAEPGFRIDTRELERAGPSYMVDTLGSIRADIGPAEPLCLIVGLDAFLNLHRWHRWRALFELAHILVMQRPGSAPEMPDELRAELDSRATATPEPLRKSPAGFIHFIPVTQLDISATQIRRAIAAGRSPRYLTPDVVLDLIRRLDLYRIG